MNESNKIEVIATESAEFTMDVGIRKVVLQREGFPRHCKCFKVGTLSSGKESNYSNLEDWKSTTQGKKKKKSKEKETR